MSKHKFAKIFEYDDMDVLVMKAWNEEEETFELSVMTQNVDGLSVSLSLGYEDIESRDAAFDNFEALQEAADRSRGVFQKLIETQE